MAKLFLHDEKVDKEFSNLYSQISSISSKTSSSTSGTAGPAGPQGEKGADGLSIYIPIPHYRMETHGWFLINHYPTINDNFLSYNPIIELMRKKKRQKFVHPTHLNGVNSIGKNYNSGAQFTDIGEPMPDRITEWPYMSTLPFQLTEIYFNILEWKGSGTNLASLGELSGFPISVLDWDNGDEFAHSTGQGRNQNHKTDVFAFRFRIDNPDTTDISRPYVFGEMSDPWKVYPLIKPGDDCQRYVGWRYKRCYYSGNK